MNFLDNTKLQAVAISQLGKLYLFGSKPAINDPTPISFDCSGFIRWVYGQVGIELPEGSEEQRERTVVVERTLQIGDVGFFIDPVTKVSKHVGMLINESEVIESRGFEPSLEAKGIPTKMVLIRPRTNWENWHEFSGWRRFAVLK